MAYNTDEEIEEEIQRLRSQVGIADRFRPDMISVLNEFKRLNKIRDWIVVPNDELAGKHARYDRSKKIIAVTAETHQSLDNYLFVPNVDRRRARFTVAHELFHAHFGHQGIHYRSALADAAEPKQYTSKVDRDETKANRSAGAFLAPLALVQQVLQKRLIDELLIKEIMELFDVNFSSAKIRKISIDAMLRRSRGDIKPLPKDFAKFLRSLRDQGHIIKSLDIDEARRKAEAVKNGFESIACDVCDEFALVREGTHTVCKSCGDKRDFIQK